MRSPEETAKEIQQYNRSVRNNFGSPRPTLEDKIAVAYLRTWATEIAREAAERAHLAGEAVDQHSAEPLARRRANVSAILRDMGLGPKEQSDE